MGETRRRLKKLTGNEEADFKGSKRYEDYPWFVLLGSIANGHLKADGTRVDHEIVRIGDGCTHKPKKPGYLYCFANDAWHFYGNNKGSVELTITRTG